MVLCLRQAIGLLASRAMLSTCPSVSVCPFICSFFRPFDRSCVIKVANVILWKRMNWFSCKLVQVVHGARAWKDQLWDREVKRQGHTNPNMDFNFWGFAEATFLTPLDRGAILVVWKVALDMLLPNSSCRAYTKHEVAIAITVAEINRDTTFLGISEPRPTLIFADHRRQRAFCHLLTSVSKTIRKPPLAKVQTALGQDQLSQRDRGTLRVIEYFAKSLEVIRNDNVE